MLVQLEPRDAAQLKGGSLRRMAGRHRTYLSGDHSMAGLKNSSLIG